MSLFFSADNQLQLGCAKDVGLKSPSSESQKKRQHDYLDEAAVRVPARTNRLNETGISLHTRHGTCARSSSRQVPKSRPRSI